MADLIIKDALGASKTFDALTTTDQKLVAKSHLVDTTGTSIAAGNPLAVADAALTVIVGDAVASPGTNTLLGRLKTIATALAGVLSVKRANRTLTLAPKNVPVAGVGIQLCAADANRTYVFFENIGTGNAIIAPGTAAPAMGSGKPLNAADLANKQGGSLELDGASAQEWWAYSTTGTVILVMTGV